MIKFSTMKVIKLPDENKLTLVRFDDYNVHLCQGDKIVRCYAFYTKRDAEFAYKIADTLLQTLINENILR